MSTAIRRLRFGGLRRGGANRASPIRVRWNGTAWPPCASVKSPAIARPSVTQRGVERAAAADRVDREPDLASRDGDDRERQSP